MQKCPKCDADVRTGECPYCTGQVDTKVKKPKPPKDE